MRRALLAIALAAATAHVAVAAPAIAQDGKQEPPKRKSAKELIDAALAVLRDDDLAAEPLEEPLRDLLVDHVVLDHEDSSLKLTLPLLGGE